MSTYPDRVQVWAAQLAANDFPPVCAMTGAPAETWRKFRFATQPRWAYYLLLLLLTGIGLLPIVIIMAIVAQRASGHLPLTRASRTKLSLVDWVTVAMLPLMIVLWVAAAVVGSSSSDQTASSIATVLLLAGVLAFIAFLIGLLIVRPLVGPGANVMAQQPGQYDRLVELKRVHPAFVAAVNQLHQSRAAYYAATQAPRSLPHPPASN